MATMAQIGAKLFLDVSQYNKGIQQADKNTQGFQKTLANINKMIGTAIVASIGMATVAMASFAKSTLETGMAFEKSLATVAAVKGFTRINDATSDGAKALATFEEKARELGKSTAYTATQVSDSMIELARAGLSANDVVGAIGPALYLAGSSASDMSSATTLLAATMKQFDLSATDATRISDVFTIAQQQSLFAMDSLTEAMKYGGTVGSAFGMSLEETTAALAQFRDLGVEGSTAGTQFRQSMIALANPTAKAKETLKKYGLTVNDVSPATKSFTEILETLGKANMDISAITDLVSKRASGSFVKLIDKFKEGTSTYNQLIQAFQEGSGAAQDTYNTMIDNVAGRVDILKSAYEELQLTFYDTFSEPMKQAIGTDDNSGLIGLVNTMTSAFRMSGNVFKEVFQDIFGTTLQSINENQVEIASAIGGVVVQVLYLGKAFMDWLPTLATIGKYFLMIFVAGKVIAMAQAVATFTTGLYTAVAAAGSLRAAMTAAVVASGGWVAVIAGIATLTTMFVAFAASTSKAAETQERLTRSLNASRDAAKEFDSAMIGTERKGVNSNTQETIDLLQAELTERNQMNNVLESQLQRIQVLNEEEQNAKIIKGELFQVTLNGTNILLDQATAMELATTQMGDQNNVLDQMYQKQDQLNTKLDESSNAFNNNNVALQKAIDAQKAYTNGQIGEMEYLSRVLSAQKEFSGSLSTVARNARTTTDAVTEMQVAIEKTQTTYVKAKQAASGFNQALQSAEAAQIARQAKESKKLQEEENAEKKKANEQWAKDYQKAIDARIKLEQELQKSIQKLNTEETAQLALTYKERLDDAKQIYDEELKYIKNNKQKRLALETGFSNTMKNLLEQITIEELNANKKATDEIVKQNIRYGDSERTRLETELQDKLQLEDNNAKSITNTIVAYRDQELAHSKSMLDQKLITQQQYDENIVSLEEQVAKRLEDVDQVSQNKKIALEEQYNNKKIELTKDIEQTIIDERLALAQRGILQELDLRQKAEMEILKKRGLTEQEIAQIEDIYRSQRSNAEKDLIDQFVEPYGKYTKQIDDLNKKSVNAFTKRAKERADKEIEYLQKKFDLEQQYANTTIATTGNEEIQKQALQRISEQMALLDKEYEKSGSSLQTMGEKAVGVFKKISSGIGKALSATIGFAKNAGKAIGQGLESGLSFFTGGAATMNIGGILTQATQASLETQKANKERQKALQEQLDQGQITQEEYNQAIQGGLGQVSSADQAKQFVDELLTSATDFAMAIASQAPLIISGLASALPILIDSLIVAIPTVIRALGDGLPTVAFALIDGIIALLPVLADALLNDALPKVIDGIIYLLVVKLPQLADTLTPIVAQLVQFIIEQAPRIVNAITSALPTVIDFLVQGITQILTGIPTLIETLLNAIPIIITELLGGVSDLVMVIFQAIPMIIEKVIMALPNIISALLRGLLGVLVQLASALPMLIAEIINLLPVLLSAIVSLIPEIIIALVDALPTIIENLILALPLIITALINLFPQLISELIKALPRLISVLVVSIIDLLVIQLPRLVMVLAQSLASAIVSSILAVVDTMRNLIETFPSILASAITIFNDLPKKIRDGLTQGMDRMVTFFKDVITEITSLGRKETATFGDTPGVVQAGANGLTARFAPDDLIIAAQKPIDLLQQAMSAVGSQLPKSLTSMFAKSFPPNMTKPTIAQGATSTTTNITIQAEGRVLDDIQVKALERGHAPKMERKLKKSSGTKVGFDRGRFNGFGK